MLRSRSIVHGDEHPFARVEITEIGELENWKREEERGRSRSKPICWLECQLFAAGAGRRYG
jgi:hypothetical protein